MSETSKLVEKIISHETEHIKMPVLTSGALESAFFYLKSCSCFSGHGALRLLSIKKLVPANYQRSNDVIKSIKSKKERLARTSYYENELKLKEYYVKICRNFNCFGCVLFTVKEIVVEESNGTESIQFKKAKRLLAIRPNQISLIDYKTKALVKCQRMTDLKSWFSGDGYYNLKPMFLLHPQQTTGEDEDPMNEQYRHQQSFTNRFENLFKIGSNSIDMDKLFVIEFRSCKWHLQIGKCFK